MEVEAKYAVTSPAVFAALLELQALGGYALRPTGERHVIDHYLDTPYRDLLRGGYASRLREGEADDRWLLTVKGLGEAAGAVHRGEEHESEIPPNAPPDEWPAGLAREIVTRLSEGQTLAELFTIGQRRARRAVEQDERAVGVLSLDTVEDVVALKDHTGELHDVDVTIGLLRHFLMHSPHASVNPALPAAVKGIPEGQAGPAPRLAARDHAAVAAGSRQAFSERVGPSGGNSLAR